MTAEGIGFENKWFRRFPIRKRQLIIVCILLLLSAIAIVLTTFSCCYSELVTYSLASNIVAYPLKAVKPRVLIPNAVVRIGFMHSWVGYHCYDRNRVDVPDLFTEDIDVRKFATAIDQIAAYHRAKRHFNVGYYFGRQCAISNALYSTASTKGISRVILAAHIVLIGCLVVFFVSTTVLFRTLSDESFLYHNIDRQFISFDHPELSQEYYQAIYNQVLHEQGVFLAALRGSIIAAFLCVVCVVCTVCGCLYTFYPHCPQGFCQSFKTSIEEVTSLFNLPAAKVHCRLGITTIIACCSTPCCIVLLLLSMVFCLIIWRDDRNRQVDEVLMYLHKICQVAKARRGATTSLFAPTVMDYASQNEGKIKKRHQPLPSIGGDVATEPIFKIQDFSSLCLSKLPTPAMELSPPLPPSLPPSPPVAITRPPLPPPLPPLPPICREFHSSEQRLMDLQMEEATKRQEIIESSIVHLKRRIDRLNADLLRRTGTTRRAFRDPCASDLLSDSRGRRR